MGLLNETGSFSSPQQTFKFVKTVALERIESMIRTAQRLKTVFMVDVASSDMFLLYENPDTVFDDARMTNEFGADSASKLGGGIGLRGRRKWGLGNACAEDQAELGAQRFC